MDSTKYQKLKPKIDLEGSDWEGLLQKPGDCCIRRGCDNKKHLYNPWYCDKHSIWEKACLFEGCNISINDTFDFCLRHDFTQYDTKENYLSSLSQRRDVNKCAFMGCEKFVQLGTISCHKHFPPQRCKTFGCTKRRLWPFDVCSFHGGNYRCSRKFVHDGNDTPKAIFYSCKGEYLCFSCRGNTLWMVETIDYNPRFELCQEIGCTKKSAAPSDYCVRHGGGSRCSRLDVHQFEDFPPSRYITHEGEDLCHSCYIHMFPDKAKKTVRKEQLVLAEIERLVPELDYYDHKWDCPIPGGCSLFRPDMFWDFKTHWFSVEIDENGHDQRDGKYDKLVKDMGGRKYILLRINPDGKEPFFRRKRLKDGTNVFTPNEAFHEKMAIVVKTIEQEVLQPLKDNVVPKENKEIKLFF